jgi:hypothetical protein
MARPSTTPVPRPLLWPADEATAAEIGDAFGFAELTPLHRSPVALRADRAGALGFAALEPVLRAGACDFAFVAGARETLVCGALERVAAAAAALLRAGAPACAAGAGATACGRLAAGAWVLRAGERVLPAGLAGEAAGVDFAGERTAPLVVAETAGEPVVGSCVPGADGALAAGAPGLVVPGPGCGLDGTDGDVGDAGVPKPGGVHAQARPTPMTPTLSIDSMVKQIMRARLCIRTLPPED